jgi:hypothetical protein
VDIKKLARVPVGGSHKVYGRRAHSERSTLGTPHLHSAGDDHSRLAYTEVLPDETGPTAAAFCVGPKPDSGLGSWRCAPA